MARVSISGSSGRAGPLFRRTDGMEFLTTSSLRPSRRPLILFAPLVVTGVVLAVVLYFSEALRPEAHGLLLLLAVCAIFPPLWVVPMAVILVPVRYTWLMVAGRTELAPEGIRTWSLVGVKRLGWDQIRSFEVRRHDPRDGGRRAPGLRALLHQTMAEFVVARPGERG